MNKANLRISVTIAIVLVYVAFFPCLAEAKVDAYVVIGADNNFYEFEYNSLLQSYAFSLLNVPSKLFEEFKKGQPKYLLDDINGYIDYEEALKAYAFSLVSGNKFDLNAYTSGPDAKIVTVNKVNVVSVDNNGNIVVTEKVIADPVEVALGEVNSAGDAAALRGVLERKASILGLDLGSYNTLNADGKNTVSTGILERRGDGFADSAALKAVFDEEVQDVKSSNDYILQTVNAAASVEEFQKLLLDNGAALGLDLQSYNLIISSRKIQVFTDLYAAVPYETVNAVKEAFNNKVAEVLKSYVYVSYTNYNLTISSMVDIQMTLNPPPQWYVSGVGWRDAPREEVVKYVNPNNFILPNDEITLAESVSEIVVTADVLNVRDNPTTEGTNVVFQIKKGEIHKVEAVQEVTTGTSADSIGYWFKITVGENTGWVSGNYVDWIVEKYNQEMLQFLTLSGSSGVTQNDLGLILDGKGILSGKESSFYEASQQNNINEIFLTSLALHETGNGTSQLAKGMPFTPTDEMLAEDPTLEPRTVYNMFGIGAIDSNPDYYGAKYAYEQGWFTPEAAIIGGASFASKYYVNNTTYRQDTLYKMRWNPGNPGKHQYATDVAWANKQTKFIQQLYNQVNIYNLRFNIPRYVRESE